MTAKESHHVGWAEQIALGHMPRLIAREWFGNNPAIGTTPEEIWPLGGDHTWLTTGTTLFITSDDAGDTDVIQITGLGADFSHNSVKVALNGTTPVQIGDALDWIIVVDIRQVSAEPAATGDLYVAVAGAAYTAGVPDDVADVQGYVDMGSVHPARTDNALWIMVPKGRTGLIMSYAVEMESGIGVDRSAEFHLEVSHLADPVDLDNPTWRPFVKIHDLSLATPASVHNTHKFDFPFACPELTRIRLHVVATTTSILGGHISTLWVPND